MIEHHHLESLDFSYLSDTDEWGRENLKITLNGGIITFMRESDNYHGLSVRIYSLNELRMFLAFIP